MNRESQINVYKATNIHNGEKVEGSAREIFVKAGIFPNTI